MEPQRPTEQKTAEQPSLSRVEQLIDMAYMLSGNVTSQIGQYSKSEAHQSLYETYIQLYFRTINELPREGRPKLLTEGNSIDSTTLVNEVCRFIWTLQRHGFYPTARNEVSI